ncbi:MAG: hypothetical protein IT534_03695 [Bauldia sp.]|nr:hypothetical protein [Bauldia sp.]
MARGSELFRATAIGTAVFGVFWVPGAQAQTTPTADWTGPYVGAYGAYAFSQRRVNLVLPDRDDTFNYTFDGGVPRPVGFNYSSIYNTAISIESLTPWPSAFTFSDSGWGAGAVVGYDHAFGGGGGVVVGVAGDYTYMGHGGGTAWTDFYLQQFDDTQETPEMDQAMRDTEVGVAAGVLDMFTLRVRAGVAMNRLLVYGTGGFAYGRSWVETYANIDENYIDASKDAVYDTHAEWAGGSTAWRPGYAIGGGAELAVTPRIALQFEGLYYNLGRISATATGGATVNGDEFTVQPYTVETIADGAIFKVGITLRP